MQMVLGSPADANAASLAVAVIPQPFQMMLLMLALIAVMAQAVQLMLMMLALLCQAFHSQSN